MSQERYREIYEEKARMNGGLRIGGCEGGASKYKRKCVKESKKHPSGKLRCDKYGYVKGGSKKNVQAAAHNPWVMFLKEYAAEHRISYAEALQDPNAQRLYHRIHG